MSMQQAQDPQQRFWAKVNKTPDCWLWTGGKTGEGYGVFSLHGRDVRAYRYAYELLVGAIQSGLFIDHLCRVPACVNPAHLQPVTPQINSQRQGLRTNNTSGYRGVCWRTQRGKWVVRVRVGGTLYSGGSFDDVHEAGRAAAELRARVYGSGWSPSMAVWPHS